MPPAVRAAEIRDSVRLMLGIAPFHLVLPTLVETLSDGKDGLLVVFAWFLRGFWVILGS
jgi:hypothetical protein